MGNNVGTRRRTANCLACLAGWSCFSPALHIMCSASVCSIFNFVGLDIETHKRRHTQTQTHKYNCLACLAWLAASHLLCILCTSVYSIYNFVGLNQHVTYRHTNAHTHRHNCSACLSWVGCLAGWLLLTCFAYYVPHILCSALPQSTAYSTL